MTTESTDNNGAGGDALKPVRGQLAALAAQADLSLGATGEARRLLPLAQAQGLTTTLGSLVGAINVRKRKAQTTVPRTKKARKALVAGRALDDAIASLETLRAYVANLEALNGDLTLKLDQVQALIETVT